MVRRSSFESKVVTAFGTAALVVIAMALSTWEVANDAAKAAQMVTHAHQLLNNIDRVRGYSLQSELTTQNFRLTGNAEHIAERNAAMDERELSLEKIRQLTIDNPDQQRR